MKTIEEKARAYDKVRKKIAIRFGSNVANEFFAEFEESEDERVRKALKQYFVNSFQNNGVAAICGVHVKDVLAWLEKQGTPAKLSEEEQNRFAKGVLTSCALSFIDYLDAHKYEGKMCVSNGECEDIENAFHNAMWDRLHRYYCKYIEKQGEQKPVDKVEPKFKVGDFIVNDYCMGRVVEITNDAYLLDTEQGIPFSCHSTRLWDITIDARDGDVLLFEGYYNSIVLFQGIGINGAGHINYHCKCDLGNYSFGIQGDVAYLGTIEKSAECYHPATKEQRDLLFQKMHEAGYTFDFEDKKLKKIEPKTEENKGNLGGISSNWSEEDEEQVSIITNIVKAHCGKLIDCRSNLSWLQSLKGRVKPQWKPSDVQIECLSDAIEHYNSLGYPASKLKELLDDLKKLKGEV